MAESKLSDIEKKKQELEQELATIQNGIDQSIDDVKEGVTTNFDPKNIIKKYPIPAVGASVLIGFLLGSGRKSSTGASSKSYKSLDDSGSAVSKELKRMLAKKGFSLLLDFLENKVAALKEKQEPAED